MAETTGSRIRTVIEESGLSAHAFAKRAGISDTAIRDFMHDRKSPGMKALLDISTTAAVTVDWLLTGEGTKYQCDAESLDPVELFQEFSRGAMTPEKMTRIFASHIARVKDKDLRERLAAACDEREKQLEAIKCAQGQNAPGQSPGGKPAARKKKQG